MPDIKDYTGKITNEHADKPKYMAMVEAVSQCFLNTTQVVAGLPDDFDLDLANDAQLDDVGLWVGISRNIPTPLTNVYFALDTPALGFDQGAWKGPFDPDNGITVLDNETYRSLIRAKIGANHWDGTLESSKAILDLIFNPDGHEPFEPIIASDEIFATGDGVQTVFHLKYKGQNVFTYSEVALFKKDWQGVRQLFPDERTNLLSYSEDFSNSAWVKPRIAISPSGPAPNGVSTSQKITIIDDTGNNYLYRVGWSWESGKTYTFSVFAKQDTTDVLYLNYGAEAFGVTQRAKFQLSGDGAASVVAGSSLASIQKLSDGWYKCSITAVAVTTITANWITILLDRVLGNAVAAWGAQLGISQTPESYIPTSSSPVTLRDYVAGPYGSFTLSPTPSAGAVLSWTGSGTAYAKGNYAYMVDNQDMTISIGLAGDPPSAIQWALLTGGYITPKPQSVDIKYFYSPTASGPLFGFDVSNQYIAGFDQGSWGNVYS